MTTFRSADQVTISSKKISGFVMGYSVYPMARSGNLSYSSFITQRFLKFIPGLGFLICFEFLWPFVGDGPLYSFESDDIVQDCSKTWWTNLLFISKWSIFF